MMLLIHMLLILRGGLLERCTVFSDVSWSTAFNAYAHFPTALSALDVKIISLGHSNS